MEGMRAEKTIQGDRAFRSKNGYQDLLDCFQREIADLDVTIHTSTVVESIAWTGDWAEIRAHGREQSEALTASKVLITLPLAVLQASTAQGTVGEGTVRFTPGLPKQKLEAMKKMEMEKSCVLLCGFVIAFGRTFLLPMKIRPWPA